ncbi:MAG: Crp/Fnr family transcriptional regulator [Candidatus Obscuribacterales bacterium]|nr:Crp/Fnr family transcriptional regulator [Candidatus Obscuribacterales bacterium]
MHPHPKNFLLQSLPQDCLEKFADAFDYVELPRRKIIAERGEVLEHVHFPDSGMISKVLVTADGIPIEVGTIGREGFTGVPLLLGSDLADCKLISQVAGYSWQISASDFKRMITESEELKLITNRFILTMLHQIAQTAACNRLHTIEERCAHWLLLAEDRAGADSFNLTQDFLSMMLAVRRSSVNQAIKTLEQEGLISHARAVITIKNRAGLEVISCACYKEIKQYYDEIMKRTLKIEK